MLVEYLLRNGYYSSALQLAKKSGLEDLTNIGNKTVAIIIFKVYELDDIILKLSQHMFLVTHLFIIPSP